MLCRELCLGCSCVQFPSGPLYRSYLGPAQKTSDLEQSGQGYFYLDISDLFP